jgi:phage host-nuclease inhibitor protein Gam
MRAKKTVLTGTIDKSAAEEAFGEYAKADAILAQITAKMDVEITKIRDKYKDDITAHQWEKEQQFEKLQNYAENNRDDFGKKKSMELTHGVLGFRTGTPKLKAKKGFTWNSVTNLLKEFLPDYVRTTDEPAKDKLLSDRDIPEVLELFNKVGIMVDQDETFFVEPKKEFAKA